MKTIIKLNHDADKSVLSDNKENTTDENSDITETVFIRPTKKKVFGAKEFYIIENTTSKTFEIGFYPQDQKETFLVISKLKCVEAAQIIIDYLRNNDVSESII